MRKARATRPMYASRNAVVALLLLASLLAAERLSAQPHVQETAGDVAIPTPPQDVWLKRLVGSFKLDGMYQAGDCSGSPPPCTGIKGRMDCIAVGNGPGVQCIINATWTLYTQVSDISSFLDPAMSLFGLDPGRSAINLMLVNDRGLPTAGFGIVKGHQGAFRNLCRGANEDGCEVGIRIEARPDGEINYMWIGTNLVISMRRVPAEDAIPPDK